MNDKPSWHISLFAFLAFLVVIWTAYKCGFWAGRENMVMEISRAYDEQGKVIQLKHDGVLKSGGDFGNKVPDGYELWEPLHRK